MEILRKSEGLLCKGSRIEFGHIADMPSAREASLRYLAGTMSSVRTPMPLAANSVEQDTFGPVRDILATTVYSGDIGRMMIPGEQVGALGALMVVHYMPVESAVNYFSGKPEGAYFSAMAVTCRQVIQAAFSYNRPR